ncbi:aminopeptidase Ey isoform X2 [Culicoides brevitarsis]
MKNINGQKYVINHRAHDGYYVSKACAVLWLLSALAALLTVFLLTYFLTAAAPSCQIQNDHYDTDGTYASGIVGVVGDHLPRHSDSPSSRNGRNNDDFDEDYYKDEGPDKENDEIKLYEGWNPTEYDLVIEPNFDSGKSNGSVTVNVVQDPKVKGLQPIVFDIKGIRILESSVLNAKTNEAMPFEGKVDASNQSYFMVLKKSKDLGNVTVHLVFESNLTDTLQGFYRGKYKDDENSREQWYASTQFSPIDARRAFPCIDRPDKKAIFKISLVRPLNMETFLSNMPHNESIIERDGYMREVFEPTPKMSTYLIAFHLSNLHRSNIKREQEINLPIVNIYTRKEVSEHTNYAFKLTRSILSYLQHYFKINLKLPKIDLVAVPDFGFRAMENTGLITFKEAALLVPEVHHKSASAEHKVEVAKVLAHELTHQWFGNLVTMKWWNDLWLKEGFATYFSYKCLNDIKPEWRILEFFPFVESSPAMWKDSDRFSHPISFPVDHASDIRRIFDPISYSKGAAIIRMINSFLGEDAFQHGIESYLKEHEYGNAVQDDLWRAFTSAGHKFETLPTSMNVKKVMDTFTLQAGYPVLQVTRDGNSVILKQQRFKLPKSDENDTSSWYIPITFATKSIEGTEIPKTWFSNEEKSLVLDNVLDGDSWIYFNVNRTGYYRVNYEPALWQKLIYNFTELPPIARAQIIDDAFYLSRAEFAEYEVPLTLILVAGIYPYDILSWSAVDSGITYLTRMLRREPAFEEFRAFMKAIFKPMYEKIGFGEGDEEDDLMVTHRARMLKLICDFKIDRCTHAAQTIFRNWMANRNENKIPPNLKHVVYCTSIREGGVPEWSFLYKRYLETTNMNEKQIILSALGCTTEVFLLTKYLNLTIDPSSGIQKQDASLAFVSVAKNYMGYEVAFDFLYTNIEFLAGYFGDGFSTLSKMIDSVTTYMNKEYHQQQFDRFAKKARKSGLKAIEKSIHLAEERIRNNVHWRNNSYFKLQKYLQNVIRDMGINVY